MFVLLETGVCVSFLIVYVWLWVGGSVFDVLRLIVAYV